MVQKQLDNKCNRKARGHKTLSKVELLLTCQRTNIWCSWCENSKTWHSSQNIHLVHMCTEKQSKNSTDGMWECIVCDRASDRLTNSTVKKCLPNIYLCWMTWKLNNILYTYCNILTSKAIFCDVYLMLYLSATIMWYHVINEFIKKCVSQLTAALSQ